MLPQLRSWFSPVVELGRDLGYLAFWLAVGAVISFALALVLVLL